METMGFVHGLGVTAGRYGDPATATAVNGAHSAGGADP
jgi:hypothetical protein